MAHRPGRLSVWPGVTARRPGRLGWLALVAVAGVLVVPGLLASTHRSNPADPSRPGSAAAALGLGSGPAATSVAPPAQPTAQATSTVPAFGGPTASVDLFDLAGKGILVLGLLFITLHLLRRVQAGPAAGSAHLTVVETRPLAARASIHLVAVGERRLVVGLTQAGMVALAELGADELPELDSTAVPVPARPSLDSLAGRLGTTIDDIAAAIRAAGPGGRR
jgi:flagellar biogenesis protein FliO